MTPSRTEPLDERVVALALDAEMSVYRGGIRRAEVPAKLVMTLPLDEAAQFGRLLRGEEIPEYWEDLPVIDLLRLGLDLPGLHSPAEEDRDAEEDRKATTFGCSACGAEVLSVTPEAGEYRYLCAAGCSVLEPF